jgi:hypothetical protein
MAPARSRRSAIWPAASASAAPSSSPTTASSRPGRIGALVATLSTAGIECTPWSGFSANPDSAMIEHGRAFAAQLGIDSLIGLGGGSSLDAAKGINFVLADGGTMKDYWGYGKATQPLLPMLGIPATTRHRRRSAILRAHQRPRNPRQNGLRRSHGFVSLRRARPAADALAAPGCPRRRRLRRLESRR